MSRLMRKLLLASIASVSLAAPAAAAFVNPIAQRVPVGPLTVGLETVVSGLISPVAFIPANDGTGRSFVVEQTGQIRIVKNGVQQAQPLADLSSRLVPLVPFYDERGLLGMALHPSFAQNGKFYTYTSEPVSGQADFTVPIPAGEVMNHQSVVTEWRVDPANPNRVDPSSRREIMRIDEPQFNHNAGALAFGPDKNLYISLGDGGSADDQNGIPQGDPWGPATRNGHAPEGNGQNLQTVLGKILRINVDGQGKASANGAYSIPTDNPFAASGDGKLDEIYAYGFRNPFRMEFSADGRLFASDAGQENVEEFNQVVPGGNFGWHVKEGTFLFNPNGTVPLDSTVTVPASPGVPAGLIDPLFQYDHDDGYAAIGGFIYNGTALPELAGKYIFGDLSADLDEGEFGRLFAGDPATGEFFALLEDELPGFLKGFGMDENGELYALISQELGPQGTTGMILRLVAAQEPIPEPAAPTLFGLGAAALAMSRRQRRQPRR